MNMLVPRWSSERLSSLTSKIGSGATPRGGEKAYTVNGTPLIRSMNVHFDGLRTEGLAYIDEAQAAALSGVVVQQDDVLLNITGASIGRVTTAPSELVGARVNQHVCIIRTVEGIDSSFVAKYFASPEMQRFIKEENYGVTRQALTKEMICNIDLPVPPYSEQRRIVAKIDSLSAKSKRARDHLVHVSKLVKHFKESVLSSAIWTSSQNGMMNTSLNAACRSITDGDHQAPPKANIGVPFITISAMNDGKIDLKRATRFVPYSYYNGLKQSRVPKQGDVLFSVTGSIGIPAIVQDATAFVFQRHIAIIKPHLEKIDSNYLYLALCTPQVRTQVLEIATGTAQLTIPLAGLRNVQIPLPSLQRQAQIVRRINNAFAWIDRLTAEANGANKLIDILDQAILLKAFRGKLVPQDPNDEPASDLLERIRAETTGPSQPRKGRGRPRLIPV